MNWNGLAAMAVMTGLLLAPRDVAASESVNLDLPRDAPPPSLGTPGGPDPVILRATGFELPPEIRDGWAAAQCGDKIALPWFDGAELGFAVDHVERTSAYTNLAAPVVDGQGSVVLTIGDRALTGAVSVGSDTYRIQDFGDGAYRIVQIDNDLLMPDRPDSDEQPGVVYEPRRPHKTRLQRLMEAGLISDRELTAIIKREIASGRELGFVVDEQHRIDVLVGYTTHARFWAENSGYPNIGIAIANMVGDTNVSFMNSGIRARLRLLGTREVDHNVVDHEKLEEDHELLRAGVGELGDLHELRDKLGADLVVLLVLNINTPDGSTACTVGTERACGYAATLREWPAPGETPGSAAWEARYGNMAFAVAHAPAALGSHTFKHEIGHKLGAHHDAYAFIDGESDPTLHPGARGWIMVPQGRRTIMSYRSLRELVGFDCPLVPFFSNASMLDPDSGGRLGNPPLTGPVPPGMWNPGHAENYLMMNEGALIVAQFRDGPE